MRTLRVTMGIPEPGIDNTVEVDIDRGARRGRPGVAARGLPHNSVC